jgi:hypothetical protein
MDDTRERLGLSFAIAGVVAATSYVAQRMWEHAQGSGADPLLVLHDPRIAFHGRALAATWWGGVACFVALALLRDARARERAAQWLGRVSIPLALALVALAYAWP